MHLQKILIKSVIVTSLFIVLFIGLKKFVEYKILEAASKRGVKIAFQEIEINFRTVRLINSNLSSKLGNAIFKEIELTPFEKEIRINGGEIKILEIKESIKPSTTKSSSTPIKIKINNVDLFFQNENELIKAHIVEASKEEDSITARFEMVNFSVKGIEGKSDSLFAKITKNSKSLNFGKVKIDRINHHLKQSNGQNSNTNSDSKENFELSAAEIKLNDMTVEGITLNGNLDEGEFNIGRIYYKNKIDAQFVSILKKKNKFEWDAEILQIMDERLSSEPVIFENINGEILISGKKIEGKIKEIPFNFQIDFNSKIEINLKLEKTNCEDVINFLPWGIKGEITRSWVSGNLSIASTILYDQENPINSNVDLKVKNGCKKWKLPKEFNLKNFYTEFKHTIHTSDGKTKEVLMGPNTENWVPISSINSNLIDAIITCEDPSFGNHNGVIPLALEISLEDNLKSGSFKRGGSTIPMQLAKNLWLGREKTISRKIQELFLAMWITQEMDEIKIIELYLNIIEFGPDIYGIGPATKFYFGKHPASLTLAESAFLASILPNPNKQRFNSNGKLNSLIHIQNIMKLMKTRNQISKKELMKGLEEWPEFRKNGELNLTQDELNFMGRIQTN